MKRLFFFMLLVVVVFSVMNCSNSPDEPEVKTANEKKTPLLEDVDGEALQQIINSYKGKKAVLVNVWATWCVPCVEEFPEIVKIQRKYPKELRVIFVSADFPEDRSRAKKFLKDHNVDWTTYFKTAKDEAFINSLSKDWTGALPFSKIIDRKGNEVAHWENKASFDTFNKHVKQAIKP